MELKERLLALVNIERERKSVRRLTLEQNDVTQLQTEEALANHVGSFWNTDGLDPYCRYGLADGYQRISEKWYE